MNKAKIYNELKNDTMTVLFSGKAPIRSYDTEYDFCVDKNFYYLTGLEYENVKLVVTKKKDVVSEILFIEKRDPKLVKWIGMGPDEEKVTEVSGITDLRDIKSFDEFIESNIKKYEVLNLDLGSERSTNAFLSGRVFKTEVENKYPKVKIENILSIFANHRLIKADYEVDRVKKAIDLTRMGLEQMFSYIQPGMKEYQIVTLFDSAIRFNGAKDNSFQTIAASGKDATVLHYIKNDKTMEDGTLVLFDLGAEYDQYAADISRTIPVNGKFTPRQKEIYELCLKANVDVIKAVKPGTTLKELNDLTKEILDKGLRDLGVIVEDETVDNYYYHGVGHHLGLDTHDVVTMGKELAEGMIITIEPGIYIAKEGIGIRIEDDILVTADGHINLSESIIKSVEDIENFMKK
jgi:Xaa-Pro aminopeptidase